METRKFVGVRLLCQSLEEYKKEIPAMVEELFRRKSEILHKLTATHYYGLHKVEAELNEDGYWCCFEVESFEHVPPDMEALIVQPSRYASLLHEGTPQDIHQTYHQLHTQIAQAGLARKQTNWTVEAYDHFDLKENKIRVMLHDPVH